MNDNLQKSPWCENVILVDADYIDNITSHLITHFEKMLERRIPSADFARWIDCIALDGGLRQGDNQTQVILIHGKEKTRLEHFMPSDMGTELNGKAFKDRMGEFLISAYPVEDIADGENLLTEVLELIVTQKVVKRIMVVPWAEKAHIYNKVREVLSRVEDKEKLITVYAMDPTPANLSQGVNFRQEVLGYSVLAALGIKADEIREK
jgi:hypothetical protein